MENIGVMSSSCDPGDHVQKVVIGVADKLYIYRMVLLAVKVWEGVWRGCLNAFMRAVYCANGVREASNVMKSSLDCDLIFCCVQKLYVLCGQLVYCIHDSR